MSEVGPRFFPLVGASAGLCFCVLLVRQLLQGKANSDIDQKVPFAAIKAALLIAGYVFLMRTLGFYVASVIIIPLLMMVGGERRWLVLLLTVSGFCLFTYFLFEMSLNIEFPVGWWHD